MIMAHVFSHYTDTMEADRWALLSGCFGHYLVWCINHPWSVPWSVISHLSTNLLLSSTYLLHCRLCLCMCVQASRSGRFVPIAKHASVSTSFNVITVFVVRCRSNWSLPFSHWHPSLPATLIHTLPSSTSLDCTLIHLCTVAQHTHTHASKQAHTIDQLASWRTWMDELNSQAKSFHCSLAASGPVCAALRQLVAAHIEDA